MRNMKNILLMLGSLVLLLTSCHKTSLDDSSSSEVSDIKELVAPDDFNWKTSEEVAIAIDVVGETAFKSTVSVYNGNPLAGGDLLQNGAASNDEAFVSVVDVPSYIDELYIVCEFPDGSSQAAEVEIADATVVYTFTEGATVQNRVVAASPTCTVGCDREISGTIYSLNIENGETVCLTGSLVGGVTFQNGGGTLRICGDAVIYYVNYNGGPDAHIEITESGTLQNQ